MLLSEMKLRLQLARKVRFTGGPLVARFGSLTEIKVEIDFGKKEKISHPLLIEQQIL